MPLAISHFEDSVLVASCVFLLELCGLSASTLRVDIAVLRRISSFYKSSESNEHHRQLLLMGSAFHTVSVGGDITVSLAKALADEYIHEDIASNDKKESPSSIGKRSSRAVMLILQHLEKASLPVMLDGKTCGYWLLTGDGDGTELRYQQKAASQYWNLVTTFCQLHQLPVSTKYLAALAQDNDWVCHYCLQYFYLMRQYLLFSSLMVSSSLLRLDFYMKLKLEATHLKRCSRWYVSCLHFLLLNPYGGLLSQQKFKFFTILCSFSLIQASKEFSHPRLRTHIVTVLKGMQSRKKASSSSHTDATGRSESSPLDGNFYIPVELFQILADCEKQKSPGEALLIKAKELSWSLLAMVASCFPDVTSLTCLTVWLEITAARLTFHYGNILSISFICASLSFEEFELPLD